ncbi:MAG: hypothetical protein ACK50Y_06970 [Flavobacteriia bacterium]|jgi:hypothetical protein
MVELLYDVLENTSIAISIIPLISLIIKWKRANASIAWLFFTLLTVELISEILNRILTWSSINNCFILHIYTIVDSCLLYLIYRDFMSHGNFKFKLWLPPFVVLFSGLIEATINHGYLRVNTYTHLLFSAQAIYYSLMFFYSLINDSKIKEVSKNSEFWINAGVLFFYGTTFCLILFERYIFTVNPKLLYYTWSIQLVANIIFHLVLARGIWLMRRT